MAHQRYLPLLGVALFCLTSMAGCPNVEPAGQLTVAQGTVTNLRTGRPLTGVRMVLVTSLNSAKIYTGVADSVLTDSGGRYAISFTNQKGLFYAISCEKPYDQYDNHLDLPDSLAGSQVIQAGDQRRARDLKLGATTVVDYEVAPRRVVQVQVTTRRTGYQQLVFNPGNTFLTADNLASTIYLYLPVTPVDKQQPRAFYQRPSVAPTAHFLRNRGTAAVQDTVVQLTAVTSLAADTVHATLRFGH